MRSILLLLLAGCVVPAGGQTRRPPTEHDTDAPPAADTDVDGPRTVGVSHRRELRGVWVATVSRLDFPSSTSLTPAAARAELRDIVQTVASVGGNAIFFQVRAEGDALYTSTREPWSRFLSGTQGTDPGYDPLAILIEEAHAEALEVHAWFNPYRAQVSTSSTLHSSHYASQHPSRGPLLDPPNARWFNPALREVQDHTVAVIRDVVQGYDVDGVHFDDYFYPYASTGSLGDDAQFTAWQAANPGSGGSKNDWRRDNVHTLVERVSGAVADLKPWVRFGISPFGIYQPGVPSGIGPALDAYNQIACDPLVWMDEGWVDYLAPQLYWSLDSPYPFDLLTDWWTQQAKGGRFIAPGLAAYKMLAPNDWPASEIREQIQTTRSYPDAAGQILFRYGQLNSDLKGLRAAVSSAWSTPALPPVVHTFAGEPVAAPEPTVAGDEVCLEHTDDGPLRSFLVYREQGDGWALDRVLPFGASCVTLPAGTWAISAAVRSGGESEGVVVAFP